MSDQATAYYENVGTRTQMSELDAFTLDSCQPLPGTVIVSIPEPDEQTPGGLVIPVVAQEKKQIGRVLAVPKDDPGCPVAPGDWVFFRYMCPQALPLDGEKTLHILQYTQDSDSDILCRFRRSASQDSQTFEEQKSPQ